MMPFSIRFRPYLMIALLFSGINAANLLFGILSHGYETRQSVLQFRFNLSFPWPQKSTVYPFDFVSAHSVFYRSGNVLSFWETLAFIVAQTSGV